MRHLILLPGLYPLTKRAQGDGGRKTELLQQTFPANIDSRQPKKVKKKKCWVGSALLRLPLPRPRTLSPPSPRSAAGPSSSWCSCGGRTRPRWAPGWRWWIGRRWCQLLLAVSCRAAGGEDNINVADKNIKKEREKKKKRHKERTCKWILPTCCSTKRAFVALQIQPGTFNRLSCSDGLMCCWHRLNKNGAK